jgi:hypothetical protein
MASAAATVPAMTKSPSSRPGVILATMVAMVPTAALETMMQTPSPPCSVPHRLRPGERRALRRARALSRPPPGWLRARLLPDPPPFRLSPDSAPSRLLRDPAAADRIPAGGVGAGWAVRRRVCASFRGSRPPVLGSFRGSRPAAPASRPRGRVPPESPHLPSPRPPPWPPACPPRELAASWPGSRREDRAPGPGGRGSPASRPRGLASGSPPYGLLGRGSRRGESVICASDVSRCTLVSGT